MKHILSFFLLAPTLFGVPEVVVNVSNGFRFYHLEYTLKTGEFVLEHPSEWFDERYPETTSGACDFEPSGAFNIYLKKEFFPISAPNCRSGFLRLMMPHGTSPESIEEKRVLWEKIRLLDVGQIDEFPIVVELNPYLRVLSDDPLEVELEYCNIYFRTAYDHYIPNTNPVPWNQP